MRKELFNLKKMAQVQTVNAPSINPTAPPREFPHPPNQAPLRRKPTGFSAQPNHMFNLTPLSDDGVDGPLNLMRPNAPYTGVPQDFVSKQQIAQVLTQLGNNVNDPRSINQIIEWQKDPKTNAMIDEMGPKILGVRWMDIRDNIASNQLRLAPSGPDTTEPKDEYAAANLSEEILNQLAELGTNSPILQDFMEWVETSKNVADLERFRNAFFDTFIGAGNKRPIWKEIYKSQKNANELMKLYQSRGIPTEGNISQIIDEDLQINMDSPVVAEHIEMLIEDRSPTLFPVLFHGSSSANTSHSGTMQSSTTTDDGENKQNERASNVLRPEDILSQMPHEEVATLHQIAQTYMSVAENMKEIQSLVAGKPIENAEEIVKDGVTKAFADIIFGNNRAQWMVFFVQNKQFLLPQDSQENNDNRVVQSLERNKPAYFKILSNLASQGSPELKKFVTEVAKEAIQKDIDAQHIDTRKDLTSFPNQVDDLLKYAYKSLWWSLMTEKFRVKDLPIAQQKEALKTIGKIFADTKAKAQSITNNLVDMLVNHKYDQKKFEKDNPAELAGKKPTILSIRNNRLTVVRNVGSRDPNQPEKEEPLTFQNVSEITTTDEWIPKSIAHRYAMEKDGTSPGCSERTITKELKNHKLFNSFNPPPPEDQNADPENAMKHWRSALAGSLKTALTNFKTAHPELPNIENDITKKCRVDFGKLLKGEETEYSPKTFDIIAQMLGTTADNIFVLPRYYDVNNKQDYSTVGETSILGFNTYGEYIYRRQEESINRGLKPKFSPTVLLAGLGMMRVHPVVSSMKKPERDGAKSPFSHNNFSKILYKLVNQPLGKDKAGNPHSIEHVKNELGVSGPNWQNDIKPSTPNFDKHWKQRGQGKNVRNVPNLPLYSNPGQDPQNPFSPPQPKKNLLKKRREFLKPYRHHLSKNMRQFMRMIEAMHCINDMHLIKGVSVENINAISKAAYALYR